MLDAAFLEDAHFRAGLLSIILIGFSVAILSRKSAIDTSSNNGFHISSATKTIKVITMLYVREPYSYACSSLIYESTPTVNFFLAKNRKLEQAHEMNLTECKTAGINGR